MRPSKVVTKILVSIVALFFLFSFKYENSLLTLFALVGSDYQEHTQIYRFFTVALLHANFTHFAFNTLALYQLGSVIEIRLKSKKLYLAFISITLFFSSLTSWLFMEPSGASVGASGLIFALLGYFYLIHREYNVSSTWLNFILVLNLSLPFFIKTIDYRAHIGGLMAGLLLGWLLEKRNVVKPG